MVPRASGGGSTEPSNLSISFLKAIGDSRKSSRADRCADPVDEKNRVADSVSLKLLRPSIIPNALADAILVARPVDFSSSLRKEANDALDTGELLPPKDLTASAIGKQIAIG